MALKSTRHAKTCFRDEALCHVARRRAGPAGANWVIQNQRPRELRVADERFIRQNDSSVENNLVSAGSASVNANNR